MNSSLLDREIRARKVSCDEDTLRVDLADGRAIIVPLQWYPRLWHGSPAERANCEIIGDGAYLHWPELDEDLTIEGIIDGRRSAESLPSLKKWLAARPTAGRIEE